MTIGSVSSLQECQQLEWLVGAVTNKKYGKSINDMHNEAREQPERLEYWHLERGLRRSYRQGGNHCKYGCQQSNWWSLQRNALFKYKWERDGATSTATPSAPTASSDPARGNNSTSNANHQIKKCIYGRNASHHRNKD
ncbi:hypothetical protein MUCCIDRAFT_113038 [Mucor lusitanicus CBS 277.49]|uniref:Uncharacterized protein n=1 Tax=Mucor lusitanicus CBS 277.49 TaxID=747725 RepID=A0A168JT14_MUCCL|nr:hypothetical protein MUCCIDRAFT_113038 [Mucor lusitanicus CBS 277.49]